MSLRSRVMRLFSIATMSSLALVLGVSFAAPIDRAKASKTTGKLPPPSGVRMDHVALARLIDTAIEQKLKTEGVEASPLASDAEFLRRVYLDITGHIPPADKVTAFLDDKEPNKRARLIDDLLAHLDYGTHLADIWQALLLPKNSDNRRLEREPMGKWLAENFNSNKPWNKLVHDLVTASGAQEKNGAVTFYLANGTVDKMTDEVCKLFLGVQLQCAQCHNHPFTDWKQTEYWEMAGFFMKVQAQNPNMAAKQGTSPTVSESELPRRGKNNPLPESAKRLTPKFLGADSPISARSGPVRPLLADWLTTAQNPYFSKAMANRMWGQFFGSGLVNPVDDMHDDNPASHPVLLQELANQFAKNDFDLKYLIRAICNSRTYQRSSKPAGSNGEAAPNLYSHMAIKVLSPEQLFDSLGTTLGRPEGRANEGRKALMGLAKGPNGNPRSAFVAFFGVDETVSAMEYQAGIPQALNLMNSPRINFAVQNNPLVRSARPAGEVIERLYLSTLSRRPTAVEMERMTVYVKKADTSVKGYGDVLWALLNSSEFTLNH